MPTILVAPKYGSNNGKVGDEPHGFDSYNFLRERVIGKRITVPKPLNPTDQKRQHSLFGELQTIYTRISLFDEDNQDLGILSLKNGMVRLRPVKTPRVNPSQYVQELLSIEKEISNLGIGIWKNDGFVRELPVSFNPHELIAIGEFDAIVENIKNSTTLTFFLLPDHQLVSVKLSGIRPTPHTSIE